MNIDPRLHRIVAAQPYPLMFATISGAHLYGFPSPDSDFDLRGAHVLPIEKVIGLEVSNETVQQEMIVPPHPGPLPIGCGEGSALEMDIVSHDVKKFFGLLLKKNGYVLEQLFSPLIVQTTPEHEELQEICRARLDPRSSRGNEAHSTPGKSQSLLTSAATGVITKHHSHHYFGFAETQWKLFLKESPRRVKPLLYVYRVLLTGIHLMRTGEIEANLVTLNEEFRLPYIADLVARKLSGPEDLAVGQLLDSEIAFHESEYQRLRMELQAAHDASTLPELPSDGTRAALNDLLVRVRLRSSQSETR
ncbi:MAG TPA: nucleotidyltransferase domain-containing protein [Verrucomicrobiae bacterium]|nr:nucleotidyltransferase domain-containing protein [Verrucomicrobiae bacterium]